LTERAMTLSFWITLYMHRSPEVSEQQIQWCWHSKSPSVHISLMLQ